MADGNIDRLEIQIQSQATKASADLDRLAGKLEKMAGSLAILNTGGLKNLASGVDSLGRSVQNMSNVKTADFNRLAKNIEKLGNINQAGINNTASALRQISSALTATGNLSAGLTQLTDLTKGISKLGSKSVSNAITNLPLLAQGMKQFISTLSTAPQVSDNIIRMTNAMANLASQGGKYNSTIKSMSSAAKNLSRAHNDARKSNTDFFASLSRIAVGYYVLKRAVSATFEPIQKAMDLGETINLFQTSFKKIGMEASEESGLEWGSAAADAFAQGFVNKAQSFNDRISEALSLDPNVTMNYQAVFAQMSNAFGLTTDSVMNLSESFTLLGLDIASFFNTDVEDAMVKLRAGLAGETEPLRTLGVDITEATLKMTAMKYGIDGTISKMSQAAKTQLRWLAIMDQTETVFGDMAKTIDSPANQVRILQQQMENLSRTLGTIFLPIVSTILPYVNAFVIALQRMAATIAGALGYELPDYTGSDIYKDVTGGIVEVGDSADEANSKAQKLQKTLSGFDKLNNSTSSSSSSSSASSGSGYSQLDDAIAQKTESYMAKFNEELNKMSNSANEIADKITKFFEIVAGKAEPTVKSLKNLWDNGLSKIAGFVAQGAIDFYNKFMVPVGEWAFGENGIPKLIDAISDMLVDIDWGKLNKALSDFWDAIAPLAEAFGTGFITFMSELAKELKPIVIEKISKLADSISKISDALSKMDPDKVEKFGEFVGFAVKLAIVGSGLQRAYKAFWGILTLFGNIVDKIDEIELFLSSGIMLSIKTFLNNLTLSSPLALPALADLLGFYEWQEDFFEMMPKWVQDLWNGFWDIIITVFEDLFNYDETFAVWQDVVDSFKKAFDGGDDKWYEIGGNIVKGILLGFVGAFGFILEPITDFFKSFAKHICNAFGIQSPAKEMKPYGENILLGIIKGFKEGWTNAWSDFKTWLSGLPAKIASGVGSLKDLFLAKGEQMISGIKSGWNNAVESFKEWLISRPSAIVSWFGDIKTGFVEKGKNIIDGLKEGWNNLSEDFKSWLSGKPSSIVSWFGDLKTKFTDKGKNIIDGIKKGWNDGWSDFKTWLSNIPSKIASGIGSLFDIGKDLITGFISGLKSITIPKLDVSLGTTTTSILGKDVSVPKLNVEWRANGGYVNTGQVFVARENGINEMVGRIGNRSAVANNDQITEGIATAVETAMLNVLVPALAGIGGGGTGDTVINIDGREVFRAVQNEADQYYNRTRKPPFRG